MASKERTKGEYRSKLSTLTASLNNFKQDWDDNVHMKSKELLAYVENLGEKKMKLDTEEEYTKDDLLKYVKEKIEKVKSSFKIMDEVLKSRGEAVDKMYKTLKKCKRDVDRNMAALQDMYAWVVKDKEWKKRGKLRNLFSSTSRPPVPGTIVRLKF